MAAMHGSIPCRSTTIPHSYIGEYARPISETAEFDSLMGD
jgi:hypothetical protein